MFAAILLLAKYSFGFFAVIASLITLFNMSNDNFPTTIFFLVSIFLWAISIFSSKILKRMNEKRKNMLIKIAQRENLNLVEEHVIADTTQAIAFDPNKRKFVYVTFATGDYLVHDISDILSWKVSRFQITQGNQYGSGEMYTLDISVADTSHPLLKLVAGGITGQARANGWSAYLEAIVNGNATGASSVKAKNIND